MKGVITDVRVYLGSCAFSMSFSEPRNKSFYDDR